MKKSVSLFIYDSFYILVLLCILLAYTMPFAALFNAVCLYNAFFFAIDFFKCFLFSRSVMA